MPLLKIQLSLDAISSSSSRKIRSEGTLLLSSALGKSSDFVMVIIEDGMNVFRRKLDRSRKPTWSQKHDELSTETTEELVQD